MGFVLLFKALVRKPRHVALNVIDIDFFSVAQAKIEELREHALLLRQLERKDVLRFGAKESCDLSANLSFWKIASGCSVFLALFVWLIRVLVQFPSYRLMLTVGAVLFSPFLTLVSLYKSFFCIVGLKSRAATDDAFLLQSFITVRKLELEVPLPLAQTSTMRAGAVASPSVPKQQILPSSQTGLHPSKSHVVASTIKVTPFRSKAEDSDGSEHYYVRRCDERPVSVESEEKAAQQRKREQPDSEVVVTDERTNRKLRKTDYLEPDKKDLDRLSTPKAFVVSFVINWYVKMLQAEAHQDVLLFTTDDFREYASEKEKDPDDLERFRLKAANKKFLVFPAFLEDRKHFVTVLVNVPESKVIVFDSLLGCATVSDFFWFRRFLKQAYRHENMYVSFSSIVDKNAPQQAPGSNDCAVFVMSFMRTLQKSGGKKIISPDGARQLYDEHAKTELGLFLRQRFKREIESKKLQEWNL
jgi:hypothetical protein